MRVWHCKKCDFTAPNAGVMASHCRLTHPKTEAAVKKCGPRGHYKPRGGQKTSGMGLDAQKERLEPTTTGLRINKDADVRHAFDILQTRSNDGTLSSTEVKDFEDLVEEKEDLKGITEWPAGLRARVIRLYNEVVG